MIVDEKEAGKYRSEGWEADYPKVQIRTIEDLLAGRGLELPPPYRKRGKGAALPLA